MKNHFSHLLIFVGFVCMLYAGYLWYLRNNPNKFAFESYPASAISQSIEKATPVYLRIPSANISTSIVPATIVNGIWESSSSSISYLDMSPMPGEPGNSILYGHNWTSLFGNLPKTKPGERVDIGFSDGSMQQFIVEYTSIVSPDEIEIIEQTEDTRITLYTCTGFLDSKRFVVVAKLPEKI